MSSLEATCRLCGNDFVLADLYRARGDERLRCPRCGRLTALPGVPELAREIDSLERALVRSLARLGELEPAFRIRGAELCDRVCTAARDASPGRLSAAAERRWGIDEALNGDRS